NTQLDNAAGFSDLIIATKNGHPVRLGEVTRVVDSVQTTTTASWYDGTRAIIMAVQRQPDANTVDVVDKVKAMLPSFQDQMPGAASIKLLNDRSTSIRQAVDDVQFTLLLTIALVVMVIFVFLRRVTATIIPAVAVPISLIATLGAMFLFGFSIDNISLMGLTLAVGLVVDDAIVMLENIFRHMEEDGLSAFDASLKGAREIGFTIISISISLVAVFIPVLLMGGVIGRIFNEFAVVVTVAILASMFVSLTLTPMLCSRLLSVTKADREAHSEGHGHDLFTRGYNWLLSFCLRHTFFVFLVFIGTAAASVWLIQASPKGFFPQEDIGQISV
ncbi:MAG: efflux RND transporter permease subunit, partial [Mesorhizobium sp.]